MFSAAKASGRARARLVFSAKNRIKWRHFGATYLRSCRKCCRVCVSSRDVKVCQNKQITEKNSDKRNYIKECSIQKTGNEHKCRVIFVSSVSRRFGLVARFAYAMKQNKTKNFVVRTLQTKQVGNLFSLRGCQKNPSLVKNSNGGR